MDTKQNSDMFTPKAVLKGSSVLNDPNYEMYGVQELSFIQK